MQWDTKPYEKEMVNNGVSWAIIKSTYRQYSAKLMKMEGLVHHIKRHSRWVHLWLLCRTYLMGGVVSQCLVNWTLDQAVQVNLSPGQVTGLCSWESHFTLTVPSSTQGPISWKSQDLFRPKAKIWNQNLMSSGTGPSSQTSPFCFINS